MANNVTDLGKVGITLKGEWSSATNYERLDAVTYEGSLYIAIKDNANVNPGANPTYWLLSAKHGEFTQQQLDDFKAEVVAESKEEMDDYTDAKKAELDTYEGTKETELNTYTGTKKTELDTYAGGLKDDFDDNASTKTTAFNDNATSKTNAFNTNATNKTTDFNDNATAKTTAFDANASDKTDDFNDNATAKTTAFNEHVISKTDEFDEHTEEMQQEIDELSANMPWSTTEQATEISVDDAAKYSRNKLELFGNTEQASYDGKNLILNNLTNQTINGIAFVVNSDGSVTINGTASATIQINLLTNTIGEADEITLPAGTYTLQGCPTGGSSSTYKLDITNNGSAVITDYGNEVYSRTFTDSWAFDRVRIVIQNGTTVNNLTFKPMLVEGNTNVPYEPYTGGASPNPDYPQDIHVVTGNNTIEVQGKNLFDKDNYNIKSLNTGGGGTFASASKQKHIYIQCKPNTDYVVVKNVSNTPVLGIYETENEPAVGVAYTSLYFSSNSNGKKHVTTSATAQYLDVRINNDAITQAEIDAIVETLIIAEGTDTNISYEPYYHADYPINLGNIELCKIGKYQDYLYKENGNWYKYSNIFKFVWNGETIKKATSNFYFSIPKACFRSVSNYADRYIWVSQNSGFNNIANFSIGLEGGSVIHVKDTRFSSIAEITEEYTQNPLVVYLPLQTPEVAQITDETLISQLDAIYEHLKLVKGTNNITVTAEDLAPYMKLTYMQDLPSKLDNLDSRLSLLE